MCGLAGFLGCNLISPEPVLAAMGEALRHRGPDGYGSWSEDSGIGLAHRRLAIVDTSAAGAQPMVSEDGRWVLVFNGEIYNYQELRTELDRECTHHWHGHSDSEVLVTAIARWGVEAALLRCNGMFALAVWDRDTRTLVLARDRIGEKPMYVGWVGGDIVFASELKALRCYPEWHHAVEPAALNMMLRLGYVPAPWSIHPSVYKLPAATMLSLGISDARTVPSVTEFSERLHHYWRLEDVVAAAAINRWTDSEEEALEALQSALDDAVRLRMLADVPVGALLSGGVDSSLVVASMARQSQSPVRTFTVGFNEPNLDESAYASATAEYFGTEHQTLVLPAGATLALIDRMPEVYDEPFADVAQLPALLVSQAARSEVTVALTGDGGDELFNGYQRYIDGERTWGVLKRLSPRCRRGMASASRMAADLVGPGGWAQRLRRQSERIGASDMDAYYRNLLTFPGAQTVALLASGDSTVWPTVPEALRTPGERMRYIDQQLSLPEGIHTKLDRASMAAGLEIRVPLLDHRLLELAWRMPPDCHVSDGKGKRLLRSLAARQAPPEVGIRHKQGFDVPIAAWLRGPLRTWAEELLAPSALASDPLLDAGQITHQLQQHLSCRADYGYALWAVLMYRTWSLRYG